ncbi:hypothetical protein CDO23_04035 [Sinorhizobium meliloti]|jgi:hypothetical protein|nr:hypothetical protein CDO23_04035 [Sinorhizobium meliloti]
MQSKWCPHALFHERSPNDAVCRPTKNGLNKCPFEALRDVQKAILARRRIEPALGCRTGRRPKEDRTMNLLMDADNDVACV